MCGLPATTPRSNGEIACAPWIPDTPDIARAAAFPWRCKDGTITYKNLAQAINEWTNVLNLSTTPTSTATGLTLGTHQATRQQQWKNSCGYVVLDAFDLDRRRSRPVRHLV
jgi:hypothetical protein